VTSKRPLGIAAPSAHRIGAAEPTIRTRRIGVAGPAIWTQRIGLLLTVLALAAPAIGMLAQPAGAQTTTTSPFSPGVPVAPATTPSTTTPTTALTATNSTTGGGGLSSTDALVIVIGAAVVLIAIAFFIWRDARRRAPVRHRRPEATSGDGRARSGAGPRTTKPRKLSPAERRRRKRGRAKR
jgi:beta-lactamase regulating signal transducer with metallopeptidase domain